MELEQRLAALEHIVEELKQQLKQQHALRHELGGDDVIRLSVQNGGTQLNRQRTINLSTGLTATESTANKRIDLTVTDPLLVDAGSERTANVGMTFEQVLLKDGNIYPSNQAVRYISDDATRIVINVGTADLKIATDNDTDHHGLIIQNAGDGGHGAGIQFEHVSASPAIGDALGTMNFTGYDDETNLTEWGAIRIVTANIDHSEGNEQGDLQIFLRDASAENYAMRLSGAGELWLDTYVNPDDGVKVSGTQVVGTRVVDARCDDALNSGDATTDGVIDSLRDAMITHGLIAAA